LLRHRRAGLAAKPGAGVDPFTIGRASEKTLNLMRPIHWEGSWTIRAPRERVYEVMTDFENWPKLFPDLVKSIRVIRRTDTAAVLEGEFSLLGRKGHGVMHLRLHPPEGYSAENTSEELGEESETLKFEEAPEGTLYRWTVEARPKGLLNHLLGMVLGFYVRRFYERSLIGPLRKIVGG
jgi:carbon monoxide dehydrogenase subunit G